jgi:hypothetical protein
MSVVVVASTRAIEDQRFDKRDLAPNDAEFLALEATLLWWTKEAQHPGIGARSRPR